MCKSTIQQEEIGQRTVPATAKRPASSQNEAGPFFGPRYQTGKAKITNRTERATECA